MKNKILFFNNLTRKKEIFKSLNKNLVSMYTCGPTVYWYAHIGNLRTYIFEDILKRVLLYNGFKVKHVMNITDVGHLISDADTGEDKIERAAKKEQKSAFEIARFYEKEFKKDLKLLNIIKPDIFVRATQTIKEQIGFIKLLEKKGFTYIIEDGVYFDTSKLKTYGRLWPKKMKILPGKRVEMVPGKKNPTDFALWKFSPIGVKRQMEWNCPWKRPSTNKKTKGFPGWHTECVVMSKKFLGIPFDIHCGGIDHILIHHTNEIAQAEAAFGKILANFWLHCEFLAVGGKKMAKSEGNIFTLSNLIEKGFDPLAFRYLSLTSHYRSKMDFTFESLKASQNALNNIRNFILDLRENKIKEKLSREEKKEINYFKEKFLVSINNDLNTPEALALMWQIIKDNNLKLKQKEILLLDFDRVFGLRLNKLEKEKIPKNILDLIKKREILRKKRAWELADKIRKEIENLGYKLEDTVEGSKVKKIS